MANPAPYDAFPEPPKPTYNNPEISYNEICLSYNGDWDLECLYGLVGRKKGGRSGGSVFKSSKQLKQYPDREIIDLMFDIHIMKDDKDIISDIKRYQVPKTEKDIHINVEKIYETIPLVGIDKLENKNEPPGELLEVDVKSSLVLTQKIKALLPVVSSSLEKHDFSLFETRKTNVRGKIKEIISRDVHFPSISSFIEKAISREPKVTIKVVFVDVKSKSLKLKEIKVTGFLKGRLSSHALDLLVSSKITRFSLKEIKVTGILEGHLASNRKRNSKKGNI